jgi:ribulose-phosphate 3-epimerase
VIHVDVMDGHFVPNITIGPPVVKCLRKATSLPLDCHLMIENPERVHSRLCRGRGQLGERPLRGLPHLHRSLELIAQHGMKPGVVLNPATRVELLTGDSAHGAPCAGDERESGLWRAGIH